MKFIAFLMLIVLASSAWGRIWTNKEGKTLEAEIVRLKDGKVFLQLKRNRKIHPLEISQ